MLKFRFSTIFYLFLPILFYQQLFYSLELYSSRTVFPYTMSDKASLRDQVLNNPDKLLHENSLFLDENSSLDIAAYIQKHPFIGYLSECLSPICPLNRIRRPVYRKEFDEYTAQLLYKYSKQGTERVTYLSYAAGELFEDLVIAAKAVQRGVKKLDIHLIEPAYALYKTAAQLILENYYTYYTYYFSNKKSLFYRVLSQPLALLTCAAKKRMTQRFDTGQEFTESSLLRNPALKELFLAQKTNSIVLARTLEYQNERFKQFLEFFTYAYPQAQVHLFIYSSHEEYLNSSKINNLDMLILADPEQNKQEILQQDFKNIAYSRLKTGRMAVVLSKPPAIITYLKTPQELVISKLVL